MVPSWHNIAKGQGLGAMVELNLLLAAQLHHSQGEGGAGAIQEIASIVQCLQPLEELSQAWAAGKDDLTTKTRIKAIKNLLQGSGNTANKAAAVISGLDDMLFWFDPDPGSLFLQLKRSQMWKEVQPHVMSFVLGFVLLFCAAHPQIRLKLHRDGFHTSCCQQPCLQETSVCSLLIVLNKQWISAIK